MAEVGSLFVRLRADASEFEETISGIGGQFKSQGKNIQGTGTSLTKNVTAPILGVAGAAVAVGADFDYQMARVQAISGAAGDDFASLRDTALDMGASTKFTATQAGEGLEYMALAGWDATQSTEALPGVLALAAAGNLDLGRSSDIVTDTMSAFGIEAADATKVADQFAATQSKSNTNVEQLGEALKMAAPQASAAGMSLSETNAALGVLADSGIKGSMAGTTLNGMLRDLLGNAEDGVVDFGDFSVALFDAEGNMRDFGDIMTDVESGTAGMNDAQRESAMRSVFQAQSLRGVNVMLATGMGRYDELNGAIENSNGLAQQQADIMSNTVAGGFTTMRSAMEGVLIQMSDVLTPLLMQYVIPALQSLIGFLSGVVKWFSNLNPAIQTAIIVVLGIIAAIGPLLVIVGTLGIMIGGAITAFGILVPVLAAILSPIGLIVLAIAALAAGFIIAYKKSETFRDIVHGAIDVVRTVIEEVVGLVTDLINGDWSGAWSRASGWVTSAKDAISKALPAIWGAIKGFVTETVPKIAGQLLEWATEFVSWVAPQIPPLLEELASLLLSIGEWIITDALPTIAEKLLEWGTEFVAWVAPQIPPLLAELGKLLLDIGTWIVTTALPEIVTKLVEWGGAFLGFIAKDVLPFIVTKLAELLTTIGTWIITTALPEIVKKLVEWGGAFLGFIANDVLPFIVGKLNDLRIKITNWITQTALPKIIEKLKEWSGAFLGFIADAVKELPENLMTIITAIEKWATDNLSKFGGILKDIGKAIIDGLVGGITDAIPSIDGVLGGITDKIPDWKGPMSRDRKLLQPTGMVIMEGLESGIAAGAADVEHRLNRLTDSLSTPGMAAAGAGQMASGAPVVIRNEIGGRVVDEYIVDVNNRHARRTY